MLLRKWGATVLVSNSNTPIARDLYSADCGWDAHTLTRAGVVNSDPTKRGRVSELLFVGAPM